MQWLVSVPPWTSRFDITSTHAGDLSAWATFPLPPFVRLLRLNCCLGERTHALCGEFHKS